MFSGNWTDMSPAARNYGWATLVGDPVKDAEKLRRQSPVNRVAEIKVPVLIVQGRLDERVAPVHADRFVSAARAAGVAVERVDYEEGHGFSRAESEADFLGRLETFLAKHLKSN
jgi:dipeptidyl aminopeptidase/acylaminoacyl peptidase